MSPIEPSPKAKSAEKAAKKSVTRPALPEQAGEGRGGEARVGKKQPKRIWPNAGLKRRANSGTKPEALRPGTVTGAAANQAGPKGLSQTGPQTATQTTALPAKSEPEKTVAPADRPTAVSPTAVSPVAVTPPPVVASVATKTPAELTDMKLAEAKLATSSVAKAPGVAGQGAAGQGAAGQPTSNQSGPNQNGTGQGGGKPAGGPANGPQNGQPSGPQTGQQTGQHKPAQQMGANPGPGGPGQGRPAQGGQPQAAAKQPQPPVEPVVGPAKLKRRHNFALFSFFLTVLLPSIAATAYLYVVAVDQYASTVGFSVRNEETSAASSILGGLSSITGGSTSQDSDALYEFIQSQQMVERIETRVDLRAMFSKPKDDIVFAFPTGGTLEDLVDYWQRVVSIAYDGGTGLIQIETSAFSPQDALAVTTAVYEESNRMIHELSAKAREDATRYAREDLTSAEERLKEARSAINDYRSRTQIVDPTASVQSQMGILNQLQSQMAEALIQLDMLRATTRDDDPRISDAELKISVIEKRISEERQKFGLGGQGIGNDDFATVVAEFERLNVDRDFAERSYLAALTALDAAKAEAQRQSRYLAVFISPTLAESAQYPRRALLSTLTFMFLSLIWSIIALIYYSVRDRR